MTPVRAVRGSPVLAHRSSWVPGRVGQCVPPFVATQQAGAELLGAFRRRIDVRYPEVEMRLLRTFLVRPAGRHVVGGPLQADPPAITGVDRDPVVLVVAGNASPAGELLVERGQEVDVSGVQRHGPQ
jgi:hypothetical protein